MGGFSGTGGSLFWGEFTFALVAQGQIEYSIYMKTLNIAISDVEYTKFGIANNVLSFSDFVDMVSKELMRENVKAAIMAADTCGLSSMTMEDISAEVRAVRQNAKSYN